MEAEEAGAMVGNGIRGYHINKRALRNKSLSITFNEKSLRDYVDGFHKRKKKRRKEALKQQEEAERRKRLEDRKRRRKEKEYALYGGAPPPEADAALDDEDVEHSDKIEPNPSVSGSLLRAPTFTASRLPENALDLDQPLPPSSVSNDGAEKKHNIPVNKKKSFKKVRKGRSRPKLNSKRDRRKGKNNANKRRH